MKKVASTDAYTILQRRDGRYAVRDADKNPVNGEEKVKILLAHELIVAPAPKADPEPEPEAESAAEESAAEQTSAEAASEDETPAAEAGDDSAASSEEETKDA